MDALSGHPEGFFVAAYALQRGTQLSEFEFKWLNESLGWFRKELPIPPKMGRNANQNKRSKGTSGISWFKPEAKEVISHAFSLVEFMERHDVVVYRVTT